MDCIILNSRLDCAKETSICQDSNPWHFANVGVSHTNEATDAAASHKEWNGLPNSGVWIGVLREPSTGKVSHFFHGGMGVFTSSLWVMAFFLKRMRLIAARQRGTRVSHKEWSALTNIKRFESSWHKDLLHVSWNFFDEATKFAPCVIEVCRPLCLSQNFQMALTFSRVSWQLSLIFPHGHHKLVDREAPNFHKQEGQIPPFTNEKSWRTLFIHVVGISAGSSRVFESSRSTSSRHRGLFRRNKALLCINLLS